VPDELAADKNHLAQMITLLGLPPPQLLTDSGSPALIFFNEDRTPKGKVQIKSLESVLGSSPGRVGQTMAAKESEAFLAFIRKTLTWTVGKRASASELINDPWLAGVKGHSLPTVN
jgi:serine/threonine-protein kinase SRPK3